MEKLIIQPHPFPRAAYTLRWRRVPIGNWTRATRPCAPPPSWCCHTRHSPVLGTCVLGIYATHNQSSDPCPHCLLEEKDFFHHYMLPLKTFSSVAKSTANYWRRPVWIEEPGGRCLRQRAETTHSPSLSFSRALPTRRILI